LVFGTSGIIPNTKSSLGENSSYFTDGYKKRTPLSSINHESPDAAIVVQESAFGIERIEEQGQTLRVSLTLSYHDILDSHLSRNHEN
jgi:hypothetical protein